jgi:beta-lactamase class A
LPLPTRGRQWATEPGGSIALYKSRSSSLGTGDKKAPRKGRAEYRHFGASGSRNERWCAANLLVKRLGGPEAVTTKFREMDDMVTRLDRYEPDLGMVLSADTRDTTSPLAYAQLVRRIPTGSILRYDSRERLLKWTRNTVTGASRLRAGLPAGWSTGNKTGTGRDEGTTNKCNDIAITFPPGKNPIIIAAYFDSGEYTKKVEARHEAVLTEVGKIAAEWAIS